MMGQKFITGFTALALLLTTPAQVVFAGVGNDGLNAAEEAARRVNLAGRQRMLSQAMAKSACFISIGVGAQAQQVALAAAAEKFALTHEALRFGNAEMGLLAETDPLLLDAMAEVGQNWSTYSTLIDTAVSNGYVSRPAMERIDEVGLVVLANMNRAVNKIANTYGDLLPEMPLLLSLTIDLSGRQRMFTQRAAKEFCLIGAGIDAEGNRENLAKTVQLFSLTLDALISGMPGMVMAAPNEEIRQKLLDVKALWGETSPILSAAAAGGEITEADLEIIAREMDRVMVLMNEAVGMYEGAIPE